MDTQARLPLDRSEIEDVRKRYCRALDRLERRDGAWRIAARRVTNEWHRCQPTAMVFGEGEVARYDLPGARDRSDPVYGLSVTGI